MKVAMVTSWKVKCGIYTYSEKLSRALADLGVDVYIVRLPRFGQKTAEILENVVNRIPVKDVDLIHVQHEYGLYQNLEGGFYGSLSRLGKPVVTTMHAVGSWEVDRVVSQASKTVIVHNSFCRARFGYPALIIPHGAQPTECPPRDECRKVLGIPLDAPVVGYCGFISNYKGLEFLLEAMTKVPKTGLVLAGGWHAGPDTEYMARLRNQSVSLLPGRVWWPGWIPDEKLPQLYGALDLVIYPSRYSTESGALITALSHGKAVLASRIGPFIEKERKGALLTFRDRRDLPNKIKRLLKHPELRQQLEEGARSYAEETSWSRVAQAHVGLYRWILEGKKEAA